MARSFKVKHSIIHEMFGDETIIVNLDTGNYYSAQGVASVIWGFVMEGASEAGILKRVKGEFEGSSDEISVATAEFLDQLVAESLVDCEDVADGGGELEAGKRDKMFSVPILQKYTDMEEMLLLDPIHEVDEHGWPSSERSPTGPFK